MFDCYCYEKPETLEQFLKETYSITSDDYDDIVDGSVSSFFSFYSPVKLTASEMAGVEKLVLHYFILRRIGLSNSKKWKQIFRSRFSAIMPYYERLLDTEMNETNYFSNPIRTDDIHIVGSNEKAGSGSNSESGSTSEMNRYLDTPQGNASRVWSVDSQGHVSLNDTYLTDVRSISDSSSRSGQNANQEEGSYEETRTGFGGRSPAELLKAYKELFNKTLEQLFDDLEECFYQLFDDEDLD